MKDRINNLIDHYRKALLIKHDNIAIYNQIAELHYQQGDLEKALETCQEVLQNHLDLTLAPKILDKVLQILGFEKEEIVSFQQLLQNTSILAESFITLETILSLSENGKNAADAKTWKEAIALGYTLRKQKRWDESIYAYFKAIEIEPSLSFPHLILQYCVLPHIANLEIVVNWYRQATQIPNINRYVYVVLGDILTSQGQLSEATTCYKNAWLEPNVGEFSEYLHDEQRVAIDYLIIGVGKLGTSSLHYYLSQYPQIVNPYKKELLFFNANFEAGLDWYLAQFPPVSQGKYFKTGEATPWYLGSYEVEKRVFQLFPNIKLISVLRNPAATMKQVFDFLELSDYKLLNYPKWNSGSYSRINDDSRQILSDFFQPHNQRLEEYLGIKFNWQ